MKRIGMFLIAAMALGVIPAMADNFAPPDYVGDPLSYHAEWEFANGPLPTGEIYPDSESNGGPKNGEFLYDRFDTHIDPDGSDWSWDPADGDGGMVNTNRNASFAINTINWVDEEPDKSLRIQVTYIGQAPTVTGANGYQFDPYHGGPTNTTDFGFFQADATVDVDQSHLYNDIAMQPNPDWEQIVVNVPQGTVIDEVVVDSISIPEPSVLVLVLAVGGGLAFVRRRFGI